MPDFRRLALACAAAMACACAPPRAWQHPLLAELALAPDLELFVIEAGDTPEWSTGRLASHRELGRVALDDPRARVQLVTALDAALAPGAPIARCFTPRHALRGTGEGGDVVEAMVCLQCHSVQLYGPGVDELVPMDAGARFTAARDALEAARLAAGLPIAP